MTDIDISEFYEIDLLYGREGTSGVVAVELSDSGDGVEVFRRVNGELEVEEREFRPWLLLHDRDLLDEVDLPEGAQVSELEGDLFYGTKVSFPTYSAFNSGRRALNRASEHDDALFYYRDQPRAFMVETGLTHFTGFVWDDVKRLQIDLEVLSTEGYDFPNAKREGDKICMAALKGSGGYEEVLELGEGGEAGLIERLNGAVREFDPDVLEGHYFFKFDLDYLEGRAERLGVPLEWGRDGSELSSYSSRMRIAEKRVNYPKFQCHGRHIADTWILAQHYDVTTREMPGYSLGEVAKYLGVDDEERRELDAAKTNTYWEERRGELREYALDDVREVAAISDVLSRPWFHQAVMLPFPYQDVMVRGNATRIDALLVRAYLAEDHSVPKGRGESPEYGGLTEVLFRGLVSDVAHADVASLYPSVMLHDGISPEQDELGLFLEALGDLKELRLQVKDAMRATDEESERVFLDSLQSTFKILINSFYGYLGTSRTFFHFSDGAAASEVTARGQEIMRRICRYVLERGGRLIELDTDGVYFQPPEDFAGGAAAFEEFLAELNEELGEGIEVELDGEYRAMLSYKSKNYALLTTDDRVLITGAALKSRRLEPFQIELMEDSIDLILHGHGEAAVEELFEDYREKIRNREFAIDKLAKNATLRDSLDTYRKKIERGDRNRAAAYELALESSREYVPGDQVRYYVAGSGRASPVYEHAKLVTDYDPENPDENVKYYLNKLDHRRDRVQELLDLVEEPEEAGEEKLEEVLGKIGS